MNRWRQEPQWAKGQKMGMVSNSGVLTPGHAESCVAALGPVGPIGAGVVGVLDDLPQATGLRTLIAITSSANRLIRVACARSAIPVLSA